MTPPASGTESASPSAANDHRIDYIEMPTTDIAATKQFYTAAFGWKFTDYGSDYTSFQDGRLAGGFATGRPAPAGGALIVIYAVDLADAGDVGAQTQRRPQPAGLGVVAERREPVDGDAGAHHVEVSGRRTHGRGAVGGVGDEARMARLELPGERREALELG
jgi:hypothetical protein